MDEALREAIRRAGGARSLGRKLGIDSRSVGRWKRCPPRHVLKIELLTGVQREALRPDLYPPDEPPRQVVTP